MKKSVLFLFVSCLFLNLFVSCTDNKSSSTLKFQNDFDQNFGWDAYSQHLKVAPAHSGRVVTYADSINPFSGGFNLKMEDLKFSYPISKVNVSAWFYTSDLNTNAVLVFELLNKDKKGLLYIKKNLKDQLTNSNQWHKVDLEIPLDKKEFYDAQNEIKIYAWLPVKGPEVLMDDMALSFQ